jgi:fibronectin type 3 domain-containing protein
MKKLTFKRVLRIITGLLLAGAIAHAQTALPTATRVQVNLTWDAPTNSPDPVAGYNAYRAPDGSTAYALLNAAPLALTPTAYTDATIQSAGTYDYIVESVDAKGVLSAPSNMASVTVPVAPLPAGTLTGTTT